MSEAQDFLKNLISLHQDTDEQPDKAKILRHADVRLNRALEMELKASPDLKLSRKDRTRITKLFRPDHLTQSDFDRELPFGDPLLQQVFRPLIKRACLYGKKLGIVDKEIGEIGTLPISSPNAMAIAVPGTAEHVVVFQRGLPLLLNRMCKIALEADFNIKPESYPGLRLQEDGWEERYRQAIRESIIENDTPLMHLIGLMFFTIVKGDPSLAPPHHVSISVSTARLILLYHVELFIIGHELAHIGRGHLDSDNKRTIVDANGDQHEMIATESAQEIEADILGWAISDACALDESAEQSTHLSRELYYYGIAAPGFFFSSVICLEKFTKLIDETWTPSDTHPPSEMRKEMRNLFLKDVDSRAGCVTASKLDIVLEEMFEAGKDQFKILNEFHSAE
jgi:hypothetical protein